LPDSTLSRGSALLAAIKKAKMVGKKRRIIGMPLSLSLLTYCGMSPAVGKWHRLSKGGVLAQAESNPHVLTRV